MFDKKDEGELIATQAPKRPIAPQAQACFDAINDVFDGVEKHAGPLTVKRIVLHFGRERDGQYRDYVTAVAEVSAKLHAHRFID